MSSQIDDLKNKIVPVLRRFGVTRAGLFGSFVRGEMRSDSDIDILIELDDQKSLLDLITLKLELQDILELKVDVVEYSTIHPLIRDSILKEQVVLV